MMINSLTRKFSLEKMPFLTIKSSFWLLGLSLNVLLKKLFFTKKIDFSKISYKNVRYFNLVHGHKSKFGLLGGLPVPNFFFLAPFLSFLLALLHSLPLRFIFFLDAVESWVLIMGKAWKWDIGQL